MWAVYGLDKELKSAEKFLGYVRREFFYEFLDPDDWEAIVITLDDGVPTAGRLKGRAFFTRVEDLAANKAELEEYISG